MQNTTQFNLTLEDNSTYNWNCLAYDQVGNSDWGDNNFTLIINSSYNLPPSIIYNNPESGAQNIPLNATLTVNVTDPDGDLMNVTFYGREPNATNWTLMAIPDTQRYVENASYSHIFTNQTKWINSSKISENIVFVTHEGDIVQNYNNIELEWQRANESMSVLDDGNISYAVLPGNHDMSGGSSGGNTDLYNKYFPVSRFSSKPWWGGNFDRNDNNYMFFSAGGDDYIIMSLEFDPNVTIMDWASGVLKNYTNRSAIVVTHDYLTVEDDSGNNVRSAVGDRIWNNVVNNNPNVFLVLSGHRHTPNPDDGEGSSISKNSVGNDVLQLVADYQEWYLSTNLFRQSGFFRRMKFIPEKGKIEVKTFSPYLNQSQCESVNDGKNTYKWNINAEFGPLGCYKNDTEGEFTLNYTRIFKKIDIVTGVQNNTNATTIWYNLQNVSLHEWYVEVVDSKGAKTRSQTWNFTTTS